MLSGIRKMFGMVKAEERNGMIRVGGIPADTLIKLLDTINKTRKINKHMFLQVTNSSFTFYSFFVVEIAYSLEELKAQLKSYRYQRIVTKIIEELEQNTWLKSTIQEEYTPCVDASYLKNIKWTLLPHQKQFIEQFGEMVPRYQLHGYLLAAPPGSGKTCMDLALAGCIVPRELAEVKIIISPKNAVGLVWADTVKKIFRKIPTYWTSEDRGAPPLGKEYYVFHYESMDRALDLAQALAKKGIKYFVIVDECHNFNNLTSKRTQNLIKLCTMVPDTYSVWASGTPVKALGTEMMPLLKSIDPKFTDAVLAAFKKIFGGDVPAANAMLAHRLGKITFKIAKTEVVSDKPIYEKRYIKLPNYRKYLSSTVKEEMKEFIIERVKHYQGEMGEHRRVFDEALREHYGTLRTREQKREYNDYVDLVTKMRKISDRGRRPEIPDLQKAKAYEETRLIPSLSSNMTKQFKKSRSIVKALVMKVQGEALGKILDKRRTECTMDLAMHCDLPSIINNAIAKTIIFCTRVGPVTKVADELEKQDYNPVRVYADTNKDLTKMINDFTEKPELNPICATFQSLSTAVPVIAANTIIMLDLPPRQHIYDQAVSRANRLGQKNQVYVYEILLDTNGEPNVSTRMDEIVSWSRDQIAALMGDEFSGPDDSEFSSGTHEAVGLNGEDNA